MRVQNFKARLLGTTVVAAVAMAASAQAAPVDQAQSTPQTADGGAVAEIVVTGTRIRSKPDTASPVSVVDGETLEKRGYTQVGEALNQLPANIPSRPVTSGNGSSSGDGKQYPNLFGLGPGRTLTLVDGHRFVSSASALSDSVVDTNMIPIGLVERIDVVQGGGAAVYGSDAIAGVVNYVMKKNFTGVEVGLQQGISTRGDYYSPSYRLTAGKNFQEGRGNVALDVEYSKSPALTQDDRPLSALSRVTTSNPANTGPNDGIPSIREVLDARFWNFNTTGVVFGSSSPVQSALLTSNGSALQFGQAGTLTPYNPGQVLGIPFAIGGDGFRYNRLGGLVTGLKRFSANMRGHYDVTDRITLSSELLYGRTEAHDLNRGPYRNILNSAASGQGPIAFNRNNPFLSAADIGTLSAASATFSSGGNIYLSKVFDDLLPSYAVDTKTDVFRAAISLDGNFDFADRNFYWSVSGSGAQTQGETRSWGANNVKLNNALNAVRFNGAPTCSINADVNTANDDAACVALNPFGIGNISPAARNYISVPIGNDYLNTQYDFLATIGGSIIKLPAGEAKFSLGYETRYEDAKYVPLPANQQGLVGVGTPEQATRGSYRTHEFSAELLVPLVGGDFTLPLVKELELRGAARHVDNSLAGGENVFDVGVRYKPIPDLTLRVSRSRNFRAPNLNQLFQPSSTTLTAIQSDPCDADRINSGPNPAVRKANCEALFAAHPEYGSLSNFQDPSENFSATLVTTSGNRNLQNEVSETWTYGAILQPRFLPGLRISADYVKIDLRNGLSLFSPVNFLATCYDSTKPDPGICGTFTRLSAASGALPAGTIATATAQTYNAGLIRYRGETFDARYQFDIADLPGGHDWGRMQIGVAAAHTDRFETSVTGFDLTRTDGTLAVPEWQVRASASYSKGPLSIDYQMSYLPSSLTAVNATIESTPTPTAPANYTHDLSASYKFDRYVVRAGVINLTDEGPSYPSLTYGDILGRRFFVAATARF